MARVTQASIGKITIQRTQTTRQSVSVVAVTDTGDDLKDTVSTVTWSEEHSLNPQDTIGVGAETVQRRQEIRDPHDQRLPVHTDGFQHVVRDGGCQWSRRRRQIISMTTAYGGQRMAQAPSEDVEGNRQAHQHQQQRRC